MDLICFRLYVCVHTYTAICRCGSNNVTFLSSHTNKILRRNADAAPLWIGLTNISISTQKYQ